MVRAILACVGQTFSSEYAASQQLDATKQKRPTKALGVSV